MAAQKSELATQQSFFAAVGRREGTPYNPAVYEQCAESSVVQIDFPYHSRELSKDDDDMYGWARPEASSPSKQSIASAAQKRKWEYLEDLNLKLSHSSKRVRVPKAKPPKVLKRPAAGEPITHMIVKPTKTSLTASPSQQQSEIDDYKASLQALKSSKNPPKAAMQILEQSTTSFAGTTLVASHVGAATPTFEHNDFPAYISRMSRQNSLQATFKSHFLFTPRASTPVPPTWESIEPDTLGARWAIEPQTGIRYLKTTSHGPAEQMATVPSLRTHCLDLSSEDSSARQPLPPVVPSNPSQRHQRVYGLPLSGPSAHWYKDLGARGCNTTSHNRTLCGKTHVEYTTVTLKEAKAQEQAKQKAELKIKPIAGCEDEMVARDLADVQRSGRRTRKQTKKG